MLTPSEKSFVKYWEEQRKGGRVPYYLLYILTGTFIASIVCTFVSMMFGLGFPGVVPYIVVAGFVMVTIATIYSWTTNEKKFKAIIQREIEEGKKFDDAHSI
jgi:hypothetical protein